MSVSVEFISYLTDGTGVPLSGQSLPHHSVDKHVLILHPKHRRSIISNFISIIIQYADPLTC